MSVRAARRSESGPKPSAKLSIDAVLTVGMQKMSVTPALSKLSDVGAADKPPLPRPKLLPQPKMSKPISDIGTIHKKPSMNTAADIGTIYGEVTDGGMKLKSDINSKIWHLNESFGFNQSIHNLWTHLQGQKYTLQDPAISYWWKSLQLFNQILHEYQLDPNNATFEAKWNNAIKASDKYLADFLETLKLQNPKGDRPGELYRPDLGEDVKRAIYKYYVIFAFNTANFFNNPDPKGTGEWKSIVPRLDAVLLRYRQSAHDTAKLELATLVPNELNVAVKKWFAIIDEDITLYPEITTEVARVVLSNNSFDHAQMYAHFRRKLDSLFPEHAAKVLSDLENILQQYDKAVANVAQQTLVGPNRKQAHDHYTRLLQQNPWIYPELKRVIHDYEAESNKHEADAADALLFMNDPGGSVDMRIGSRIMPRRHRRVVPANWESLKENIENGTEIVTMERLTEYADRWELEVEDIEFLLGHATVEGASNDAVAQAMYTYAERSPKEVYDMFKAFCNEKSLLTDDVMNTSLQDESRFRDLREYLEDKEPTMH